MSSVRKLYQFSLWHTRLDKPASVRVHEVILIAGHNNNLGNQSRDFSQSVPADSVRQSSRHLRNNSNEWLGSSGVIPPQEALKKQLNKKPSVGSRTRKLTSVCTSLFVQPRGSPSAFASNHAAGNSVTRDVDTRTAGSLIVNSLPGCQIHSIRGWWTAGAPCEDKRAFELDRLSCRVCHCISVKLTGGKLFHGRPPAVVTMRERDAMRCGINVDNSGYTTTILNDEFQSYGAGRADLGQSYHLARNW